MSRHFNLHPHVVLSQSGDTHARPQRLMVRHVFSEVADHGILCLLVQGQMVRVDPEDLLPTFSAGGLEGQFDVLEGLVDLRVDFAVEDAGVGLPTTWENLTSAVLELEKEREPNQTYPVPSIQCGLLHGPLGCT